MSREKQDDYDALFLHSRRETIVLLIAFTFFLFWSVGVSYFSGYTDADEQNLRTVLGMPRWVFWGVAVPWMASNLFTFWFCLFYMKDDPLGEELDSERSQAAHEDRS